MLLQRPQVSLDRVNATDSDSDAVADKGADAADEMDCDIKEVFDTESGTAVGVMAGSEPRASIGPGYGSILVS